MSDARKRWLKAAAWMALFCGATYVLFTVLPVKFYVSSSASWIQAHPTIGAVLLPLILAVGIPLCIPSPGFEILAGSMFGIVMGTLLCVVGKTVGQLIAFLVARYFGKDRLNGYIQARFPTFAALATVLQSSSWKPLLLIQVANIPHLVKCYGLAIADISAYRFVLSSAVGGLPYALLWVYIGFSSKSLVDHSDDDDTVELSKSALRQRMMIGVCDTMFTMLGMWRLVVYAKNQLQNELQRAKHQLGSNEHSDDTSFKDDDEVVVIELLVSKNDPIVFTVNSFNDFRVL